MQKFNDPCIKTGDFARLCGTNKRTLIHYDEIGLFKPAYTDDRGYRYYSESQFDVFFTINCLSKLGMPLREIGAFLNHRNPQALKKLLLEQREEVLKEEERIRKTRQVIETKLALVSLQEKLESNQHIHGKACDIARKKEYGHKNKSENNADHFKKRSHKR